MSDDYIRREDATKALTKLATDKYSIEDWYESYINTLIDVDDIIKTIQSADVRPAMRGGGYGMTSAIIALNAIIMYTETRVKY